MEELLKISKEYYVNCVDLRLFGLKGAILVLTDVGWKRIIDVRKGF